MDARTIIQRYDTLWTQRKTAEQTWQWIERYVVPFRGKFFRPQTSEHEIEWSQRLIYDSTAIDACDTLAASLHGSLTSPQVQWFSLRFRDDELNENPVAAAWLEDAGEEVYNALRDSNFGLEINETYLDLCSFGTGVIVEELEEKNNEFVGLNFQSVSLREAFFEEDHKGQIKRFYRLLQWLPLQIIDKFGRDNVPEIVRTKADSAAHLDSKMDVIFCIYDREDKADADISRPLAAKERPFGFKYILKEGEDELGEEGGYYEMPAYLPRWKKVSGSRWGHSPAHIALPSILQLNQVMEIFTSAAEKALDPPMITEQRNVLGDLNMEAEGITVVRDVEKLRALTPETRMEMVQFEIDDLRQIIRSAFRVDQLELKESPAMTATEVMARVELMNRLLGPTMGRLQSDLFDRLITRTFNILWRARRLPDPPAVVMEAQAQMDIEYQGPLARAQKSEEATTTEQYIAAVLALAEIKPDIVDNIDLDQYARELAKMRQVPMSILTDPEQMASDREDRAARQNAQGLAELAQQAGAGMKEMGEGMQALEQAGGEPAEVIGEAA